MKIFKDWETWYVSYTTWIQKNISEACMSNISLCQVIVIPIEFSKADIIMCHLNDDGVEFFSTLDSVAQ